MIRPSFNNCNIYNYRTLVTGDHALLYVIKVERKRENEKLFLSISSAQGSAKSRLTLQRARVESLIEVD